VHHLIQKPIFVLVSALFISICLLAAVFLIAYAGKIVPGVYLGTIDLGGLTREQAKEEIQKRINLIEEKGIVLQVGEQTESISADAIDFKVSIDDVINEAWNQGRNGQWYAKIGERFVMPFTGYAIQGLITVNQGDLEREIDALSTILGTPKKDVRLDVSGINVEVLYDTKPGQTIHAQETVQLVRRSLENLDAQPIQLTLYDDIPQANPATAPIARQEAIQMLAAPLTLTFENQQFIVSREQIGSWITSDYEEDSLKPGLDGREISKYVTQIAAAINIAPQKPKIVIENKKVTTFVPPRAGRSVDEKKTIQTIIKYLSDRKKESLNQPNIIVPVKIARPVLDNTSEEISGITELIGRATTPFTGSPANRISNIKNGVRFLSGLIVKPGEEFSTLNALGTVDNTTGYLPELVIKGDKTTPEFGGGLCQVSTTLFRAVLNAGLPITARRNHSYRVSYYEHDATGNFIGPGLDATIYSPEPDLRFKNDTPAAIVIIGYVQGDKVTFELYGTSDGRTSLIEGPTLLTEFPAGDPIYVETDTLPAGVVKQIETAHPGGSTFAKYTITYPDGRKISQDFKSYYRRWPARFLVGTKGIIINPAVNPMPVVSPTHR